MKFNHFLIFIVAVFIAFTLACALSPSSNDNGDGRAVEEKKICDSTAMDCDTTVVDTSDIKVMWR